MYINKEKFKQLSENNFDSNLHKCAKALDLNVSNVSRMVNGNNNAGRKFLGSLMNYCQSISLDFNEFIFLTKPLHETNAKHGCNSCHISIKINNQ